MEYSPVSLPTQGNPADACIIVRLTDLEVTRTILDNSQDTIYFKDRDSRFLLNSAAHARQFGFPDPEEMIGKSDFDFYPSEFAEKARADEVQVMQTGKPIIGRIERWEKDDGSVIWFSASKYPLFDERGAIIGTWGTTRDITALKQAEIQLERVNEQLAEANARLRELSIIDELSGLYNRRYFYDVLQKTVRTYDRRQALGSQSSFCLVLLDIDNFKRVNDTYGHLIGDAVIRHIGKTLTGNIRTSDYTFRYGGDEYAVLLPDSTYAGGLELSERLRKIIQNTPYSGENIEIPLTASFGITAYTKDRDVKDLVRDADKRLYESKRDGKNRVS